MKIVIFICCLLMSAFEAKAIQEENPAPSQASAEQTITTKQESAEITTLLRLLAKAKGKSIVISSNVEGTITVDFQKAPVDEALASILQAAKLHMEMQNNMLVVQPESSVEKLQVFPMHYINVNEVHETLKSLYQDKLSIQADMNANLIVALGPQKILNDISSLLNKMDRPKKQVLIEAAIVEVTLNDSLKRGVDISATFRMNDVDGALDTIGFATNPVTATNPTGLFSTVGTTRNNVSFLLEILDTVVDLNVLSHPKVIGINDEQAQIIVGEKLGYRLTTTTQTVTAESVQFLEVGTQLKFTPHITENNDIILEIHPEVSDGSISEDGLPNETTTEITTKIRVHDGHTVILGGLIRERQEKTVQGVPLLRSIPLLGALFERNVTEVLRSEILIFLTPRIVDSEIQLMHDKKEIENIQRQHTAGMKEANCLRGPVDLR